jgi:protease IV
MKLDDYTIKIVLVIILLLAIVITPFYIKSKYPLLFPENKPSILVIDVNGEIISTAFPGMDNSNYFNDSLIVSSTDIVKILQHYENDDSIKAFILEIDSNGGGNSGADELRRQIYMMDKPVVSVIHDQALSAGYWVAVATKRIYANALSNIADLGIVFLHYYEDKEGDLRLCEIPSAKYKNMYLDDCQGVDPKDEDMIRKYLAINHASMVEDIAYFRNLSVPFVKNVSDGTIFKGVEAVNNGLIDEIGDTEDAVKWLEKQLGMDLKIVYLKEIEN